MHQKRYRPDAVRSQYRENGNLDARAALHGRYSTNPIGWQRWIIDRLHILLDGSILELGCGPTYLWQENAHRVPADWQVTLTDASTGMVRAACWGLRAFVLHFTYAVVDAQSIPFPASRFDAVIANHTLHHVPDQERALSEICRVLAPGGCLYASTVSQNLMRELSEMGGTHSWRRVSPAGLTFAPRRIQCVSARAQGRQDEANGRCTPNGSADHPDRLATRPVTGRSDRPRLSADRFCLRCPGS